MILILSLIVIIVGLRIYQVRQFYDLKTAKTHLENKNLAGLLAQSSLSGQFTAMLTTWLEIGLFFVIGGLLPAGAAVIVVALFVASRMRALQEVGHSALHSGFGSNRKRQWAMADLLGNFWLFKPNSKIRYQAHVVQHHAQANTENDPNIVRLRAIGFVPGITGGQFSRFIFYPLSLRGIRETIHHYLKAVGSGRELWIRVSLLSVLLIGLFFIFGGWAGASWILSLLFFYPLFSWWSLLAEHRWFFVPRGGQSRFDQNCDMTPRTVYSGWIGHLIRYFISPCTDSLHLAHHIYPSLHWRYLPAADQLLSEIHPAYHRHTKASLFGKNEKSVFGELRRRMTEKEVSLC
jgi:fatty acid desaturase